MTSTWSFVLGSHSASQRSQDNDRWMVNYLRLLARALNPSSTPPSTRGPSSGRLQGGDGGRHSLVCRAVRSVWSEGAGVMTAVTSSLSDVRSIQTEGSWESLTSGVRRHETKPGGNGSRTVSQTGVVTGSDEVAGVA